MNRSNKTRLLSRDKYRVIHSDRLYSTVLFSLVDRLFKMANNTVQPGG